MCIREIKLTRGMVAIVDESDFEEVSKYKWQAVPYKNRTRTIWYAQRAAIINDKRTTIQMQRQLMGVTDRRVVDHKNGNGLDNRRNNMRVASRSQNQWNTGPICRNSSGFKGVSFHRGIKKYRAYISANGNKIFLGWFNSAELAAEAYRNAAQVHHGQFARTQHFEATNAS